MLSKMGAFVQVEAPTIAQSMAEIASSNALTLTLSEDRSSWVKSVNPIKHLGWTRLVV